MNRRSSNWFLWLWATVWCGGSFPIAYNVWVGNFAGNTWGVRLFIVPFVAIGAGVLYWLVIQIVHRQRVGDATLHVSPSVAHAGDSIRLSLHTERGFTDTHDVQFKLVVERNDDGWSVVSSVQGSAVLHAQLRSASATLTVPPEARESSHRFRCRAQAEVQPWKHAPFMADVAITASDTPYTQSTGAVSLSSDDPFAGGFGARQASPPRGAREIAPGVWQWTERSRVLQVLGVILLVFAGFWLRTTLPWDVVRRFAQGVANVDLHVTGGLLFSLPFAVGGLSMAALGLALLLGYARYTVERGGLNADACAIGMVFFSRRLTLADVRVFQPCVFARTNTKVSTYTMAARTASGQIRWYPFTARTPDDLRELAHWIAQRAGLVDAVFDPEMFDQDLLARARRDGNRNEPGQRSLAGYRVAFRKLMLLMMALALLGLTLMIGASFVSINTADRARSAIAPTPLISAAMARDATTARRLMQGGANVNMQHLSADKEDYASGRTSLWWAVFNDDLPMVRLLMEHQADPQIASHDGWSPISKAAQLGRLDALMAILETCDCINRATPFPYDAWGKVPSPPLLIAIAYRNAPMVKRLIERGADTTTPGPCGFPVGHFAAYFGDVEALKAMRASGVDFRKPIAAPRPHAGQTYLMHAAHGGKREAIEYLLSTGVDPGTRDASGKDAADHALAYGHTALVEYLRTVGAPTISK